MRVQLLGPDDFRSMPWRNGKGTTVEMAREDDADGATLWRVSVADVIEAGPFSRFPGVDRILTLIAGPGFTLDFSDRGRVTPVQLFRPVCFSGDWNTCADDVCGPSRDLNVMTSRGKASAVVHIHRNANTNLGLADRTMFFCPAGHPVLTIAGVDYPLGQGSLALVSDGVGEMGVLSCADTVMQIDVFL